MELDVGISGQCSDCRQLLTLPSEIRRPIWLYSCIRDWQSEAEAGGLDKAALPTSRALTQVSRQVREETLGLHYRLNSFRVSICQFSDWLAFIGTHATELTSVRLGMRCACQGFDIYGGRYPWHDRRQHLIALLEFCTQNPNCVIVFHHPEQDIYKAISEGEMCRTRVSTSRPRGDLLHITGYEHQTGHDDCLLSDCQRMLEAANRWYAGYMIHEGVTLLYTVMQDIRAHCFAWRCVFREGIITTVDIPDFTSSQPQMIIHIDYSLLKPWMIDSILRSGKVKMVGRANIVFVESGE